MGKRKRANQVSRGPILEEVDENGKGVKKIDAIEVVQRDADSDQAEALFEFLDSDEEFPGAELDLDDVNSEGSEVDAEHGPELFDDASSEVDSKEDLAEFMELGSGDESEMNSFELENEELEEAREAQALYAEEELKVNIRDQEAVVLPDAPESLSGDPKVLRDRIEDILGVLGDLKNKKQEGKSRSDYVEILKNDLSMLFGYNKDLIEILLDIFGPAEAYQYIEASENQRPITIRTNTLKTRRRDLTQSLIGRGMHLEPVGDWSNVGLKIFSSPVPVGATPEYLAGYYMLQSASSFCPVMALGAKEGERVLEVSAAPGGKSAYIAAEMKNAGVLIANDFNKDRQKATIANLHRLGVRNAVVTNYDGKDLPKHFKQLDRVLLDAPCAGLGIISRDSSVKTSKTFDDIQKCSKLQKELVLAAFDILKVGGTLVYSTCSISVHENEEVIAYALAKRFAKVVDTGLPFGVHGMKNWKGKVFPPELDHCRRFYPHVHNMDGFFVAKFVKTADGSRKDHLKKMEELETLKARADEESEEREERKEKQKQQLRQKAQNERSQKRAFRRLRKKKKLVR